MLTNERKQMSKTTMRKRIALTATTALFAGMLTVVSTPVASANHPAAGSDNQTLTATTIGVPNSYLMVATRSNTGATGTVTATTTRRCPTVIWEPDGTYASNCPP